MRPQTIGIPRAFLYHRYGVLWTTFFEDLGCEVVLSPESNRALLERGSSLAVDETCLPLKVLLGHVDALRGRVDHVLVPRLESLHRRERTCVKLLAAYDIVANSVPDVHAIGYSVHVVRHHYEPVEMLKLGLGFSRDPLRLLRAYVRGKRAQGARDRRRAAEQEARADAEGLKVLVVGHDYNLDDEIIGRPLVRHLEKLGVTVVLSEEADRDDVVPLARRLSRDVYWTFNIEQLAAVERYRDRVDGIVFVVTFPCGPDSLVTELCTHVIPDPPLITIVLDELQAEAGLRTRLESFVDIIAMRRQARDAREASRREEAAGCVAS